MPKAIGVTGGYGIMGYLVALLLVICSFLHSPVEAQTWPNEPSGSTLISDHNFTTCEANGWTGNCNQITSDATAPLSPTSVMRWVYSLSSGFGDRKSTRLNSS